MPFFNPKSIWSRTSLHWAKAAAQLISLSQLPLEKSFAHLQNLSLDACPHWFEMNFENETLREPSTPQSQVSKSTTTADISNEQLHVLIIQSNDTTLAKSRGETAEHENNLIIHYAYEKRLHSQTSRLRISAQQCSVYPTSMFISLPLFALHSNDNVHKLLHKSMQSCLTLHWFFTLTSNTGSAVGSEKTKNPLIDSR